jgi:hypothetical protein
MNLPRPPAGLDKELLRYLTELAKEIEKADQLNRKTNANVQVAHGQQLLMLGDDDQNYEIAVVGGSLTATPA